MIRRILQKYFQPIMQYILFFARARNANAKEKINDEPPSLTSQATVVIPHCQFSGFSFILFLVSFLIKKCATQIFL